MKFNNKLMRMLIAMTCLAPAPAWSQLDPTPKADPVFTPSTVYMLITDRFVNGNPDNDQQFDRHEDRELEIGTFHGGDFAGITQKVKQNYFHDLGVQALWISPPFEQIHGWVPGGNGEFKHYGYHGYFTLDFTRLDPNFGTEQEFQTLIDTAHQKGLRVIVDVVVNHPGYADLWTLHDYGIDVLKDTWFKATPQNYQSFIDYQSPHWKNWWGGAWVRAGLPGYPEPGISEQTKSLYYLPDFRTESSQVVALPPLLAKKKDTRAKTLPQHTVRQYLVTWLSDWVRRYGIDGFRVDTANHVEPETFQALKAASVQALRAWKKANPQKKVDDAEFWMLGEAWGHKFNDSAYFDAGFDAMMNFGFQPYAAQLNNVDAVYADYAMQLQQHPSLQLVSFMSSHDTWLHDRDTLLNGATTLLLAPGIIETYYGDEIARPQGFATRGDILQAVRSPMNWTSANKPLLTHWQKLAQFRARHPAVAWGQHRKLSDKPYAFSRVLTRHGKEDRVAVILNAQKGDKISLGESFPTPGEWRDAYTGKAVAIRQGAFIVTGTPASVILLESGL
jgi:alpha-amylase